MIKFFIFSLVCLSLHADNFENRYDESEIKEDIQTAWSWIKENTQEGYEKAKMSYESFKTDENGTDLSEQELLKKLSDKAEAGSAISQYYLGLFYLHAKDTYQDRDKAIEWLKKSMGNGCQSANEYLENNKELFEE